MAGVSVQQNIVFKDSNGKTLLRFLGDGRVRIIAVNPDASQLKELSDAVQAAVKMLAEGQGAAKPVQQKAG